MGWQSDLMSLAHLKPDWDSYGGKVPEWEFLQTVQKRMEPLLDRYPFYPSIVPLSCGGVQFEWHLHGHDLEIEFRPGQEPEASWAGSLELAQPLLERLRTSVNAEPPPPETEPPAAVQPKGDSRGAAEDNRSSITVSENRE